MKKIVYLLNLIKNEAIFDEIHWFCASWRKNFCASLRQLAFCEWSCSRLTTLCTCWKLLYWKVFLEVIPSIQLTRRSEIISTPEIICGLKTIWWCLRTVLWSLRPCANKSSNPYIQLTREWKACVQEQQNVYTGLE